MITEATLDDVPQLCELLGDLFEQESDFKPDLAKQIAGLRLIIENPQYGRIFVMRLQGTVAAMVNLLSVVSMHHGG